MNPFQDYSALINPRTLPSKLLQAEEEQEQEGQEGEDTIDLTEATFENNRAR